MTSMYRRGAAALVGLTFAGSPLLAQRGLPNAQRGGPPNPDTPQLLVAVFQAPDHRMGVQLADELRQRVQDQHSAKELYAIPKSSIENTLRASGFAPDSMLLAMDLMELAKQVHGDYVLEGVVTRKGDLLHAETRLLMPAGSQIVAQPLPAAEGKDPGEVAKRVERLISEAMPAMPAYRLCTRALRAAKYDEAIAEATKGLQAYPGSTPNRLCILSAYSAKKASPDSIIAIATAITTADSTSMIAWANLADAYTQKKDTEKALQATVAMYRLDPTNIAVLTTLIDQTVTNGQAEKALTILETAIAKNPGDPNLLRKQWAVHLYVKQYKNALKSGAALVNADSAAANLEFYSRQIGAAQADSNIAAVQQLAASAAQKFPKELSFQLLLARSYFNAGQLPQALAAARRAQEIDPKNSASWQIAVAVHNQLNQPDSAIATAQKAIAAGVPKDTIGASLLAIAGPALKKAQETRARSDWEAALKASETVDAIAPSVQSAFYVGVSAFQVATDVLQDVQKLVRGSPKKAEQQQACALSKQAEDLLAKTSIAMPKGGAFDKNTAGQILSTVPQLGEFITSVKKAFCK